MCGSNRACKVQEGRGTEPGGQTKGQTEPQGTSSLSVGREPALSREVRSAFQELSFPSCPHCPHVSYAVLMCKTKDQQSDS